MQKIVSLFKRDYEVVEGAEWVIAGEGVATVKFDGTACMLRDGHLFKRYDAKKGRTPPTGWEPCEDTPDEHTGHWPGWLPVGAGPEDRWHLEAMRSLPDICAMQGTYELLGPRVQANPYDLTRHILIRHGDHVLLLLDRCFLAVQDFLSDNPDLEGIVWHHGDGRMAKIKRRDFGMEWPTDAALRWALELDPIAGRSQQ